MSKRSSFPSIDGNLVFGSSYISELDQLSQKSGTQFKNGQNGLENIYLASYIYIRDTLC